MKRLLTGALVALASIGCQAPEDPPPNVVVIVIDTLRADRVGHYGGARGTTPNLDALARGGITFRRAYSASSWTLPSIGAILTGLYPSTLHAVRFKSRLPGTVDTLAERLARAGYRTAGFVSHVLVAERAGFDQGFDHFDSEEAQGADHVSSRGISDRALAWIDANADGSEPFFLFLHYFDPHYRYTDHAEFAWCGKPVGRLTGEESFTDLSRMKEDIAPEERAWILDVYDEEVRFADLQIGRVLRRLESLGRFENTIFLFTADHGEQFFEHGILGHGSRARLHEEVVRVPFVARLPEPPLRSVATELITMASATPTILELLGIDADPDEFQADPLDENLRSAAPLETGPIYNEYVFQKSRDPVPAVRRAWIGERWKLSVDLERGITELFDVLDDPAESRNLASEEPERLRELGDGLEVRRREIAAYPELPVEAYTPTADQIENLRGLGYVGN